MRAPLRALDAGALALLQLGADPGGRTNPHRHKNPLSPLWSRSVMSPEPFALDVDQREGGQRHHSLRRFLPTPPQVKDAIAAARTVQERPRSDHPDPSVAFESNSVWRHLASAARQLVIDHRDQAAGPYDTFLAKLVLGRFSSRRRE